ncbi:MAG: Hsp20 family protein [Maricaulis sp.]|jgi:molecular chaperone IbpA|nr:Hsp20 family protein [Maricaulis sp.]MDG2044765.1 Hsp20 family protein [Maricaulis sp.]
MRTVDFTPLYRSIVGFDRLADMMDSATKTEAPGYPPYNIQHLSEDEYLIELAVAGFDDADLGIEVQKNILTISGRIVANADNENAPKFLYRGIAERAFERRFHLADHVEVSEARLLNGMLSIRLLRDIPEAAKPKRISISTQKNGSGTTTLVDSGPSQAA